MLAAGAALSARAAAGAEGAAARRPNVILIYSDDQGTVDMGCYGSPDLRTPNMDALAARGVRFTQFYSAAPICSPSRAALMTGRYPQRAGLATNAGGSRGLPPEEVTIAEVLRAAGYRTAIFGKWHLGLRPEMSPLAQGFDEFFGHKEGCTDNYSHFYYWSGPNRHDLWRNGEEVWEEGRYLPDLMVREARRFLRENAERPFFLYLPSNLPHYPMQGEAKYRALYEKLPEPRRAYAALLSTLDDKIGEILAEVDRLGLRDRTLIIFQSDNGHSTEERANWGGGSAGPHRGAKFSLFEGGIRIPAIASFPGRIPAGEVRAQPAIPFDWLPTIAEICGVGLPERVIDGLSLVPVLASADAPAPHGVLHWESGNQWAVREGAWKLIANARDASKVDPVSPEDSKLFLGNLDEDPAGRKNVAAANPEVVKRLRALHVAWAEDVARR
ncbi:MAG: sulfatase-like hydrolase/transferase [Planctomycetes bacterium]|nr:sulfatase-like hydrolase/transferase [Planctomycetota bacterium]